MNKKISFIGCASVLLLACVSCNKSDEFVGTWQMVNPSDITAQIPAAANATSLQTITFEPSENGSGEVFFSSLIDVTQAVDATPELVSPYEVSVAATATIKGTWTYYGNDRDDLLISFDRNTLNVNVDPSGVTFRQNTLTNQQLPVTDSITTATANLWKQQITSALQKEFTRYQKIDDIKVKNNNGLKTLKFEIENPEQDLYFKAVN